ncbi:NUDIX hydrolase [Streptomyces albipurpureus]|uniref:NUDIX hydrolase n=1 Tax=Streptomyces albipurpureus TaxID=2897419 RepID=A0ABT0UWJ0_9ACTN|nr:NUDIX hydrolase [Streptomyces sp. CWNU-1]MCM2392958.1 NUDIX hydrolase [Streptomyces sp. CWNU-1]
MSDHDAHGRTGPQRGDPAGAGAPGTGAGFSTANEAAARASDAGALRKVARVVLLDPQERILLMHGYEPDDPTDSWWFTPGGGLEGAESREEAARRELAEETGITEIELGPVIWRRICSFPFDGRRWHQDEWYFLARTAQPALGPRALTELEQRSVSGLRWWTSAELSSARETVYPTKLAELLRTLLAEGPPSTPVDLGPEIV